MFYGPHEKCRLAYRNGIFEASFWKTLEGYLFHGFKKQNILFSYRNIKFLLLICLCLENEKHPDDLQLMNGLRNCVYITIYTREHIWNTHIFYIIYMYIYTYNVEYYSAIKKNEILSFAGKWMQVAKSCLVK
jgi:hypothetical protein